MKNTIAKLILSLFMVVTGTKQAQQSQSFSEKLLGSYKGTGTLFGQKATFTMTWEKALNDRFMRLAFENRYHDTSGTERILKATAYYDFRQNKGYWFDSRGTMLPLRLEVVENSMTILWGDETTEKGKTIYLIEDKTQLNVQDFVYRDTAYVPFGKASYNRIEKVKLSKH
ncbi:MAG: hypothetical protein QNJ57_05640 [Flavobacteriaceae bacterium]|nr:hypothetical protein [Flavobacteriaceae bacterium]